MIRHSGFPRRKQNGASAVELALILPILVAMTSAPLFVAIFYWHYTAAQKAAYDAARYLATISEAEMRRPVLALAARDTAAAIVNAEIAELGFRDAPAKITFVCGAANYCDGVGSQPLPPTITVGVQLFVRDTLFNQFDTGEFGWSIATTATVRYTGK